MEYTFCSSSAKFLNSSFEYFAIHLLKSLTFIRPLRKLESRQWEDKKHNHFFRAHEKLSSPPWNPSIFFKLFSRLSVAICNIIIQFSNFYELCWHMMVNFNLSEFRPFKKNIVSVSELHCANTNRHSNYA